MESNIYQQQNNYLAPNVATQDVESILKLQEMIFIYNAIKDGWTVRMLEDGRFEFQKEQKKLHLMFVWIHIYRILLNITCGLINSYNRITDN